MSSHARARVFLPLLIVAALILGAAAPVAAQYGGISGLFVVTSPDRPGVADFNGIGCQGGSTVTLYLPPVPLDVGGTGVEVILGTTTAISNDDPLLDGAFLFRDVTLPANLRSGFYEVHARCGDLNLIVLVQLTSDGKIVITPPDNLDDILNPTPGAIAFTGRESSRLLAYAAALIGIGSLLVGTGRLSDKSDRRIRV
ncbi:MAG: hypothetical protein HKN94_02000 [Acidimicrobiales bacterium]|nr:hypothetical protein [Acidimicrobiales bacterium]